MKTFATMLALIGMIVPALGADENIDVFGDEKLNDEDWIAHRPLRPRSSRSLLPEWIYISEAADECYNGWFQRVTDYAGVAPEKQFYARPRVIRGDRGLERNPRQYWQIEAVRGLYYLWMKCVTPEGRPIETIGTNYINFAPEGSQPIVRGTRGMPLSGWIFERSHYGLKIFGFTDPTVELELLKDYHAEMALRRCFAANGLPKIDAEGWLMPASGDFDPRQPEHLDYSSIEKMLDHLQQETAPRLWGRYLIRV